MRILELSIFISFLFANYQKVQSLATETNEIVNKSGKYIYRLFNNNIKQEEQNYEDRLVG